MNKKNIIKINENILKKIISESVRKVLEEENLMTSGDNYDKIKNLIKICIKNGGQYQELESDLPKRYDIDKDAVEEILTHVEAIKSAGRFDEITDIDGQSVILRIDDFKVIYISGWFYLPECPDKLFSEDSVKNWDVEHKRKAKRIFCICSRKQIKELL